MAAVIGNLTDALIHNAEEGSTSALQGSVLVRVTQAALQSAKDTDKVRSNAVRALGNAGRLFSLEVQQLDKGLFKHVIDSLLNSVTNGSAKVRWNTCYALGNLLKNPSLGLDEGIGWLASPPLPLCCISLTRLLRLSHCYRYFPSPNYN